MNRTNANQIRNRMQQTDVKIPIHRRSDIHARRLSLDTRAYNKKRLSLDLNLKKQELDQAEAMLYNRSISESTKNTLYPKIAELQRQIEAIEWQMMSVEDKKRFQKAKKNMWKKFESSGYAVVIQREKSSE